MIFEIIFVILEFIIQNKAIQKFKRKVMRKSDNKIILY